MPMTPATITDAAVRHARRTPHDLRVTATGSGSAVIDPGDGRGTLVITTPVTGHALLVHRRPGGGGRQAVLAQADAVEAAAAWIDGAGLPPSQDPAPLPEAVEAFYQDVWETVTESLPAGLDEADHPGASQSDQDIVVGGPEGARLAITARLDAAGALTGAAWQGRRADGASIAGHGSTSAAIAAARDWAATLDQRPVITGAEAQARREATGATQADLARLMGLAGPNTISRWETGARAPRDPRTYLAAIEELEALADDLYQQALADGQASGRLVVWDRDHDYWAAVPTAAQQATPAAMARVAAARAAAALRAQGAAVRIIPGAQERTP
ncbi:helix-turn-helix domain-containing protein [Actinomyces sp. zg296]|uniref:helix-turn-helix domain-containing protein n=1 Tax=Actinomyces sp. zg296 TaxID=2609289 RepID=UPI001359C432|nr:helix-turn-helix transcriptional regulator [Actinomyces sp. zg296]